MLVCGDESRCERLATLCDELEFGPVRGSQRRQFAQGGNKKLLDARVELLIVVGWGSYRAGCSRLLTPTRRDCPLRLLT